MLRKGTILKSDSRKSIRVDEFMATGGQGDVYAATNRDSGEKSVVKIFKPDFADDATRERSRFLVHADLRSQCGIFWTPTETLTQGKYVGHCSPFAPGENLNALVETGNYNLLEGLTLASAVSHAVARLHALNMGHGDLHCGNVLVHRVGSVLHVYLIDFDNFWASGVPEPRSVGQILYMAPELSEAMAKKRRAVPDERSECFALAVILHEIMLLKHLAYGADHDPDLFQEAMRGGWRFDPARGYDARFGDVGYPIRILTANVMRLFRAGLSPDPSDRPSAADWSRELSNTIKAVTPCPLCNKPFLVDSSKTLCPYCRKPFPPLTLRTGTGRTILLADVTTRVGRNDLGGSLKVSKHHAVFRRLGPETTVESIGKNGTARWDGTAWKRLTDGVAVPVEKGDRLRFADVEAEIL